MPCFFNSIPRRSRPLKCRARSACALYLFSAWSVRLCAMFTRSIGRQLVGGGIRPTGLQQRRLEASRQLIETRLMSFASLTIAMTSSW